MNKIVYAMIPYKDDLVVSGEFTKAGEVATNCIASWDGVHGGDLIAGGFFKKAGDIPAQRIARWDGKTWHSIGTGMNESVNAMIDFRGKLIAAGWFRKAVRSMPIAWRDGMERDGIRSEGGSRRISTRSASTAIG